MHRATAWPLPLQGDPFPSIASHGSSTNEGGLVIAFEAPRSVRVAPRALPSAAPARWSEVAIYPMNGETIGVAIRGEKPRHFHALELGMAHKVTRNPSVAFSLLLHLCARRGRTDWRSARFAEESPIAFDNFEAFKMQAYALRRILKARFGIEGEPYSSLGKRKDLVTAFRAIPAAPGEMRYVPKAI